MTTPLSELSAIVEAGTPRTSEVGIIFPPVRDEVALYHVAIRLTHWLCSPGAVEEMARLIDPSPWRVFDGYLADVKRKYKGQDAAYDPEAFKDKKSMAVAVAILSTIAQHALEERT